MEAIDLGTSLGQEHFGEARLGDKRRTRRLVKVADQIFQHPGGTLPEKLKGWADLSGLYRLARRPEVTHGSVLASHRARTLELMRQTSQVVLVVHDWTELDFTSKPSLADLGQIGQGGGRGYICHNSLAITPQRQVIGLAAQVLHKRRCVPKGETPAQKRQHPQRESRLWLAGCQQVGAAPPGKLWVDICDRGSDTFEFLSYEIANQRHFVIRCARDRNLAGEDHVGEDQIYHKLHAYVRNLPDLGRRSVQVPATTLAGKKISPRIAEVRIAAGPVTLSPPHFARGEHQNDRPLDLWAVHVREIDPPAGIQPLEWLLLCDLPADTFEAACQKVDWYECRPTVEDYHKGMKTGIGIEGLCFQYEARLEPVIALLSVVTAVLLQLRQAARERDADLRPASDIVPPLYVKVLSGWRYKEHRPDLSVKEFSLALARLGGHLNRKHDGLPGWLTLWRGWQELRTMVQGVEAMRCV